MKKLFVSILSIFIIVAASKAQNSDFKPSGNLWGLSFGDYYYVAHSDSLGRGAGNVQYKPYSTTSTLNAITGVTPTTTANAAGDITKVTLATTKSNLFGSGTNNYKSANAFQLRRFYLGYDYNFAPKFTAYVILADEQDLDESGYNSIFLKYANVKWSDFYLHQNLTIGQLQTPTYGNGPFSTEASWGYRAVERTIMDMHNNDASSDLGISLDGNIWRGLSGDSLKPNILNYILEVGNNNSAKPANNGYKRVRATLYTSLLQQRLTLGAYGDFWTINAPTATTPWQQGSTFKFYASYKTKRFKIGTEVFDQVWGRTAQLSTSTAANPQYRDIEIFGWSIFASGKILENLNAFARLDVYNPDLRYHNSDVYTSITGAPIVPSYVQQQTVTTSLSPFSLAATPVNQATVFSKQTFYTIGLDYTPVKRVHIIPNIWVDQFKSLVNLPSGATHAAKDYDFVPRVTFYYIFNSSKSVSSNGLDN